LLYVFWTNLAPNLRQRLVLDISQHSHEIGIANLPFTRRGRKAAVQQEKEKTRKQAKTSAAISSPNAAASTSTNQTPEQFTSAIALLAPLPGQTAMYPQQPQQPVVQQQYAYAQPAASTVSTSLSHDRWENMATLFEAVRGHARNFEYPTASVAALETVLIRLYLESPVTMGSQTVIPNGVGPIDPNIQPNLGESSAGSADDDG
jgi:hypothetical protein